jgi:hypothetical protein
MKLNINTWAWIYLLGFFMVSLVFLETRSLFAAIKFGLLPIHIMGKTLNNNKENDGEI